MKKIGDLRSLPDRDVYERADGHPWVKLNPTFHTRVVLHDDGTFYLHGSAETLDPDELVDLLSDRP